MKTMKTERKIILAVAFIVLFSQLVQAGILYYAIKTDLFKGNQGDAGYTPIKGIDYNDGYTPVKGIDYDDGYTPIKGIDYRDGIDGKTGGRGPTGTGSPGSPGKDAPVNHPSVITNASFSGYYHEDAKYHMKWFVFNITVNISDSDSENTYLRFNYRENESNFWTDDGLYYTSDGSGTYSDSMQFGYYCPPANKTIYWGVCIWDGSDITFKEYNYTIYTMV
jgi:hypothetical protein